MKPTMHIISIGYGRTKTSVTVGDIIAFKLQGKSGYVMHRIVGINGNRIIVKGDNRQDIDVIEKKDIAYKVLFFI